MYVPASLISRALFLGSSTTRSANYTLRLREQQASEGMAANVAPSSHRGLGAECSHPPRVPHAIHIGDDDDEEVAIIEETESELQKMERAQNDFDKYLLLSPSSYGKAGKEDMLSEALSGFLGQAEGRTSGSSTDGLRTDPYSRSVPATPTTPIRGQLGARCDGTLAGPVEAVDEDESMPVDEEAPEAAEEVFTPQKRPRNAEEEKRKQTDEKEEKDDSNPDAQRFPPTPEAVEVTTPTLQVSQTQPFVFAGDFVPPPPPPAAHAHPHPAGLPAAHPPAAETSANDTDRIITQVSTQVANQLSSQFTELFGQMSTNITKLTTEMGKIDTIAQKVGSNSKVIKDLKTTTGQNLKKHTTEINEKVSANIRELADLAKRVQQLEGIPSRAAAAAAAPTTPNRRPDSWAEYRMRSPPTLVAATPMASPLASSPTISPATPPTFCPRHVHVQGWASFKSPDGVPPNEATAIALSIKNLLGADHQNPIQDVKADFWANTRFTIGPDDYATKEACWTLKRALDDALNRHAAGLQGEEQEGLCSGGSTTTHPQQEQGHGHRHRSAGGNDRKQVRPLEGGLQGRCALLVERRGQRHEPHPDRPNSSGFIHLDLDRGPRPRAS